MPPASFWRTDVAAREVISALEHELGTTLYRGVSLGDTLQDLRLLFRGAGDSMSGLRGWMQSEALRAYWWLFGAGPRTFRQCTAPVGKHDVLVASISKRDYAPGMLRDLVAHIGAERCVVLTSHPGVAGSLPGGVSVVGWQEGPRLDLSAWRARYVACEPGWEECLSSLKLRFKLTPYALSLIRRTLLVASQRFDMYLDLIREVEPQAVLVDFDRNPRAACLVLAARRMKIPTLTLVHGSVHGPDFFMPIIADRVLCWGESQREMFTQNGTEPDRVEVVGFHRVQSLETRDGEATRGRYGFSLNVPVIMYVSNPITLEARKRLVETFCEALAASETTTGLVRLHPDERLPEFSDISSNYPEVRFFSNEEMSSSDAFELADVVVAHSSGFAGEAVARGCVCVILDAVDVPVGPCEELIEWAGAPRARDASELAGVLSRIVEDSDYRGELRQGGRRFSRRTYAATGCTAYRNIADAVNRAIRERSVSVDVAHHRVATRG